MMTMCYSLATTCSQTCLWPEIASFAASACWGPKGMRMRLFGSTAMLKSGSACCLKYKGILQHAPDSPDSSDEESLRCRSGKAAKNLRAVRLFCGDDGLLHLVPQACRCPAISGLWWHSRPLGGERRGNECCASPGSDTRFYLDTAAALLEADALPGGIRLRCINGSMKDGLSFGAVWANALHEACRAQQ